MGVPSFSQHKRKLGIMREAKVLPSESKHKAKPVLVDFSYVLHRLSKQSLVFNGKESNLTLHDLTFQTAVFPFTEEEAAKCGTEFANSIIQHFDTHFPGVAKSNIIFFAEGLRNKEQDGFPSKTSTELETRGRQSAKSLGSSLATYLKLKNRKYVRNEKTAINRAAGRPSDVIMFHCLEELEEHGYKIILVAKSETDFAIISYASSEEHPEDTEFVVVGSDGDLVCFAGDARIEVLYDSFSGTYFLRSELLRELGLEGRPDLLLVCYSMCKGSNVEFTGLSFLMSLTLIRSTLPGYLKRRTPHHATAKGRRRADFDPLTFANTIFEFIWRKLGSFKFQRCNRPADRKNRQNLLSTNRPAIINLLRVGFARRGCEGSGVHTLEFHAPGQLSFVELKEKATRALTERYKAATETIRTHDKLSVYYNEFIERFGTERFASKVLLFGTQLADGAALRRPSKAIQIVEFFADGHRKQDSSRFDPSIRGADSKTAAIARTSAQVKEILKKKLQATAAERVKTTRTVKIPATSSLSSSKPNPAGESASASQSKGKSLANSVPDPKGAKIESVQQSRRAACQLFTRILEMEANLSDAKVKTFWKTFFKPSTIPMENLDKLLSAQLGELGLTKEFFCSCIDEIGDVLRIARIKNAETVLEKLSRLNVVNGKLVLDEGTRNCLSAFSGKDARNYTKGVLKLICDNYNKAAEEHCAARGLKKLKFMFGDQLLHVLAVAELGNLKTLALQASSRLARESIKRKLEQKITNKYVVKRLVATIGRLVMGVKTSKRALLMSQSNDLDDEEDEEKADDEVEAEGMDDEEASDDGDVDHDAIGEDEDDDDEMDLDFDEDSELSDLTDARAAKPSATQTRPQPTTKADKLSTRAFFSTLVNKLLKTKLSENDRGYLRFLLSATLESLQHEFLPPNLFALRRASEDERTEKADECRWMALAKSSALPDVLAFIHRENALAEMLSEAHRQTLYPEPSSRASFVPITSRVLASVLGFFLRGGSFEKQTKKKIAEIEKRRKEGTLCVIADELSLSGIPKEWTIKDQGNLSVNIAHLAKHQRKLWRVVMPGLFKFVDEQRRAHNVELEFACFGQSDGESFHALFYNRHRRTAHRPESVAVKKHKLPEIGFSERDFRWLLKLKREICKSKTAKLTWEELVGTRVVGKGYNSLTGFRGKIVLSSREFLEGVYIGPAALDFMTKVTIFGNDTGLATIHTFAVSRYTKANDKTKGGKRTITLNSEHCFHEKSPGNRKHLIDHACREDNDLSDVEAASRLSLRTSNLTTFRENVKAHFFDSDAPGRRLLTASRARRGLRRKRMSRRQGYNSTLANDFLAYDDAFHYRNGLKDGAVVPAFVGAFGIPTYKAKSSPARADIEWLAKKMLVFMINEDYSSQLCPKCYGKMIPLKVNGDDFRRKECPNQGCMTPRPNGKKGRLQVNRDHAAAFIMTKIFIHIIVTGERPREFTREFQDPDSGGKGAPAGPVESATPSSSEAMRVDQPSTPSDKTLPSTSSAHARAPSRKPAQEPSTPSSSRSAHVATKKVRKKAPDKKAPDKKEHDKNNARRRVVIQNKRRSTGAMATMDRGDAPASQAPAPAAERSAKRMASEDVSAERVKRARV